DHSNEVVDGMKVRTAHVLRGPFYEDDIETRFARVAAQYRDLGPNRRIVPFDLVGQFVSNGGRVEISGALTGPGRPQQNKPPQKQSDAPEPALRCGSSHGNPPGR